MYGPKLEDAVAANFRTNAVHLHGASGYSRQSVLRRRPADARRSDIPLAWHDAARDEPARQLLANTLISACDLIGAERGFVLVLRDETTLEIACTRALQHQELLDSLLGVAARALHRTLAWSELGLADCAGILLPCPEAAAESGAAAVVSLPLQPGPRQRGALCLLRGAARRCLSDLDFEILGALAGQAELALGAASQRCALSRLEASLTAAAPAPYAR